MTEIEKSAMILESMKTSVGSLRRLMDLDIAGRCMMSFMRGHMSEILEHQSSQEYFAQFYGPVGREMLQYDDYSFSLHHCSRFLFWHWKEEIDLLRAGPLGEALSRIGGGLPEMRDKPTAPTRGPGAVQGSWYREVYEALESGRLHEEKGVRNEVIAPQDCVLQGPAGLERIWGAALVYACDVWARQIPVVWELVREAIAMRRLIDEQMSTSEVSRIVANNETTFRETSLEYAKMYGGWQEYHATTVEIHDPMFARSVKGLFAWAVTLAPDINVWAIKAITKDEMYREVAATILGLRGKPVTVKLPEPKYWRVLHFAPEWNRIGAPGMPPFNNKRISISEAAE